MLCRKMRFAKHMINNNGIVVWITGLSAAGKTSIGKIAHKILQIENKNTVFLDGDICREVFGNDLGHIM
jgi:cytidine diphosphoramidate kinase